MPTGASVPGFDRREHIRVHYIAPVEILRGSATLHGSTSDISLGGMTIEMKNPLWVGAEFEARVALKEGEWLTVGCVVRRIISGRGMGVEFTDIKPAQQISLRRLLEDLPH